MKQKIRVALIFGGKSAEHEISLQSAKNVYEAIDKETYDVVLIGIDKQGKWLLENPKQYLRNAEDPKLIALHASQDSLAIVPANESAPIVTLDTKQPIGPIDVAFPIMHGPNSEDGTIQGFLKLLQVPFVGPSVLGAAVTMDKDVTKRLLLQAGIPTVKFLVYDAHEREKIVYKRIVDSLGSPFFVKPPTHGSSVGVSKVKKEAEFKTALDRAFSYDRKVLIETAVNARELECGVLGNEEPLASVVGEVIPHREYYSYEAKYIDENGATLQIPADIPSSVAQKVQELSIKTFQVLNCEGLARVDFFLDRKTDSLYVNEVNPIPGFTKISMYPKLWEASGVSYTKLIDRLLQLAIDRHQKEKSLDTSWH